MSSVRHGQVVLTKTPLLTEKDYASDSQWSIATGSECMYVEPMKSQTEWHRLLVVVTSPLIASGSRETERNVYAHDSQFELPPVKAFRLKWTERHECEATIDTDELAEKLGIGVERLLDMDHVRLGDVIDEKLVNLTEEFDPEVRVFRDRIAIEEERD